MPHITIIVAAALATLALAAPVATAMPERDEVGKSAAAQQDLRRADTTDVSVRPQTHTPASDESVTPQTGTATLSQDFRSADARDAGAKPAEPVPGLPTWPVDPEPIAPAPVETTPVAGDGDTSPLVYILPGIALSLLLAAGLGYAVRTSGRARRARISV
jgi:hypothetical protein